VNGDCTRCKYLRDGFYDDVTKEDISAHEVCLGVSGVGCRRYSHSLSLSQIYNHIKDRFPKESKAEMKEHILCYMEIKFNARRLGQPDLYKVRLFDDTDQFAVDINGKINKDQQHYSVFMGYRLVG
jgi:hypothetical protein